MNFEEFLEPREPHEKNLRGVAESDDAETFDAEIENTDEAEVNDIDVQKAVVEALAADKAEQDELIALIKRKNETIKREFEDMRVELEKTLIEAKRIINELDEKKKEVEQLKAKVAEQNKALADVGEVLAKNSETDGSNKISLLDRDVELPDRFPGETRDHILEVLVEARDKAEAEGRIRRAQILESVLKENEPSGNLVKKREQMEKLFKDNQNLITGTVIEQLKNAGLTHKNGENFLMASEIMRRNY